MSESNNDRYQSNIILQKSFQRQSCLQRPNRPKCLFTWISESTAADIFTVMRFLFHSVIWSEVVEAN